MAKKITNIQDLAALKEEVRARIGLRGDPKEIQITVHMGTCGIAAGARDVLGALLQALEGVPADKVVLRQTGCAGLCDREPMLTLTDRAGRQFRYGKLDARKAQRIVRDHVIGEEPVADLLMGE